jgi:hypothetical protein
VGVGATEVGLETGDGVAMGDGCGVAVGMLLPLGMMPPPPPPLHPPLAAVRAAIRTAASLFGNEPGKRERPQAPKVIAIFQDFLTNTQKFFQAGLTIPSKCMSQRLSQHQAFAGEIASRSMGTIIQERARLICWDDRERSFNEILF